MTGTVNKRRTDRMEPNRRETENEKTGRQGGGGWRVGDSAQIQFWFELVYV